MKKENIHKDISGAAASLLKIARESAFNPISDNCSYILSEIKPGSFIFTPFEYRKRRKTANRNKIPKTFSYAVAELEELYPDLHEVNLYIYKAEKKRTIVEIQYLKRKSIGKFLGGTGRSTVETMLHCKVPIPPYCSGTTDKFDINWELGTFYHRRRMLRHCIKLWFCHIKHALSKPTP